MIPTIRLDEENFQEIFETARKRIPLLYPEWTNFNENDSGIALLELFSWLKEVQEFHLNQVGLEHESVYLKLLGIERKEICPARTVVTCCSVKEETELPEGFQFHAGEIPFCSVERTRLFFRKALAGAYREYRKAGICLGTGVGWIRYGMETSGFYGDTGIRQFSGNGVCRKDDRGTDLWILLPHSGRTERKKKSGFRRV